MNVAQLKALLDDHADHLRVLVIWDEDQTEWVTVEPGRDDEGMPAVALVAR